MRKSRDRKSQGKGRGEGGREGSSGERERGGVLRGGIKKRERERERERENSCLIFFLFYHIFFPTVFIV